MREEYGRIRRSRELGEACKVRAEGTPKRGSKGRDEGYGNGMRKCGNGVIIPKRLPEELALISVFKGFLWPQL